MLRIEKLNVYIQKTPILRDVNLNLAEGSMVGLVGRNGAGKTTLLRTAMGLMKPASGTIYCAGQDMASVMAHERVKLQVGYMPEDRRLIPELTAEENILIPAWSGKLAGIAARLAWIYELMPEVAGFRSRRAMQLSGGQQKLVALARALMCGSKLLLLDEPFEGIAPALSRRLADVLFTLKAEGLSVLLSESDYSHSAGLVDKVLVIERGHVTEKAFS
jgi:branched-chain amino acid transport system ATP-binding protein